MADWISNPMPRAATWQNGNLTATLEDDGSRITITLRVSGVDPFIAMVERKKLPQHHYYLQDLCGAGFSDPRNFGKGAGTFLGNTLIQYLKAIADPVYPTIKGEIFHMKGADPPGHDSERSRFFEHFGASVDGTKGFVEVSELRTVPMPLPFTSETRPVVVDLALFR